MKLKALYRQARAEGASVHEIARAAGMPSRELLSRISGERGPATRGRVREASEFQATAATRPPRRGSPAFAWSLRLIRQARDEQIAGTFERSVRMAEAYRTDDALFVARQNRLAPLSAIPTTLEPARDPSRNAAAVCRRAAREVVTPRHVLKGIHGTLVDHGLAVGYLDQYPSEDGTRVEFRLREWPLEFIRWNESRQTLEARTDGGLPVTVTHGDGRWVVFQKKDLRPWADEACALPAALLWAAHAFGLQHWLDGAQSHGQAKIIGELPAGVTLAREDGTLSPEASAFLSMLNELVNGTAGAGIHAAGSKASFISNTSNAWQVFSELINNREKAAARIYLGTDASLGSVGGAPGVDISALFNVATTLIQGDFEALESGLNVGVYQPWAAINLGSSRLAPRIKWLLPDPDAEQNRERAAANRERLATAVERLRAMGAEVTQETVNGLALEFGVPAPKLVAAPAGGA